MIKNDHVLQNLHYTMTIIKLYYYIIFSIFMLMDIFCLHFFRNKLLGVKKQVRRI